MADELVDALEEMQVGFGLHVQRRGAKDGRVQPRPGLRRCDRAAVQWLAEDAQRVVENWRQSDAFAFRQIDQRVARERRREACRRSASESACCARGPNRSAE